MKNSTNKKTQRPGFTMVELMLVLLIGGIIVLAGVQGYKKLYLSVKADAEAKKIALVVGGVERVKHSYNNGAYLDMNNMTPIQNIPILIDAIGGENIKKTVSDVYYRCSKIEKTVKITVYKGETSFSHELRELIVDRFNSQFSSWKAIILVNVIHVFKENVICK